MGDLSVLESNSDRKKGSQKGCKKKKKKNAHVASGSENGTANKDTLKNDRIQECESGIDVEHSVNDPALIAAETKKAKNLHNQNGKSKRFDIVKYNKKSTKGRELKKKVPDDSSKTLEAAKVDKIHNNTNDTSNTASDSPPRIKYTIVVSLPSVDFSEPAKTPTKSYNSTDSELELHGNIEFAQDKQPAFDSRASTPVAVENLRTPICSKSFGSIRSKTRDHDSNDSMKNILCSKSFVKEAEKKSTCYTNKTFSRTEVLESLLKIITPKTAQKETPSDMRNSKISENKKVFTKKLERKTRTSKRRPKSIQRLVHEARGTSPCSQIIGEKKTLKSDTSKTKKKRKNRTNVKKCGSASEEEVIDLLKSESC